MDMVTVMTSPERGKLSESVEDGWLCLDFRKLVGDGFAIVEETPVKLLIAIRGMCMIDVFTFDDLKHVAFLDFDLARPAALDSAFASPFIGLPFNALVRRTIGRQIIPFDDLRGGHHVGFFVESEFRNKGEQGFWNLDELMMAVALELAFEQGRQTFVVKPTDDKLEYYRRKYDAKVLSSTGIDRFVGIDIEHARDFMAHMRHDFDENGRVRRLCVKYAED